MLKRWMILLLALISLTGPAVAEVYEGKTAALSTVRVCSAGEGVVEAAQAAVGQRVRAGQSLYCLRSQKTFASQDGTVSLVYAGEGDDVDGDVLEIMPVERYTIYCTVDKAYQSAASTLVHSGETVYVKCTTDGSHRAVGVVVRIDGEEYRVLTIGGELYVGETVYLYRDADFTVEQRVGIGTVVVSDTQTYQAEGELTLLRVAEGDEVERGQLLYATGGGEITAPVGGVVSSLSCQPGDAVEEDRIVAEIVPEGAICVEFQADETAVAGISPGDAALLTFAGHEDEDAVPGTVIDVSAIAESGSYTVRIRPETDEALCLGMSVSVRME